MSQWTYVKGKFTIRFATDYFVKDEYVGAGFMKDPLDIYKVLLKAPRIIGSEEDCIYSVDITDPAPYSEEDDFVYYEAKIKIKGRLRDGKFEKTDQEIRNFIKYLKEETGYDTKFVEGKIEVSNRPFGVLWDDDEDYQNQIYNLGEKD